MCKPIPTLVMKNISITKGVIFMSDNIDMEYMGLIATNINLTAEMPEYEIVSNYEEVTT